MITDQEIKMLLHPKEHRHFILALIALAPITLILISLVVGTFGFVLLFFALAYFLVWFSQELMRTWFLAHSARVDEHSFPGLHRLVEEVKHELGYKKPVETFVIEEGTFNCLLMPFFQRKILIIHSGLLEQNVSLTEAKWVVARFVGSLRAKSYRLSLLQALISTSEKLLIFNILLYPYERAVVMSGDRLGLALIGGDITSAISAMNRLCVGAQCASQISLGGIASQERDLKGFFGFLVRIFSSHPPLVHRYRELLSFARDMYPHRLAELRHQISDAPHQSVSRHPQSAA